MNEQTRRSGPPTGPHSAEDVGHGTNAAMWTACGIGLLAAFVGTWASLGGGTIGWILTAVLVVVALVVLAVMNRMGMGEYTNQEIDSAEDSPTVGIS